MTTGTFPIYQRENSPTMFWLGGTRDLFGEALFVSLDRDGKFWLWQSNRPYGANDKIGEVSGFNLTQAEVETALTEWSFWGRCPRAGG
jgi:hypothetical protein